jgi:DNA repair photolyase
MSKSIIYETKGRAREYSELAINLFQGCGHACKYCYGADVTHQSQENFTHSPVPRVTEQELYEDALKWKLKGETRRVLLCFTTDPYQPIEIATQITRSAIRTLHAAGLNVIILTKGGKRSMRDFALLGHKDAYATTLTCDNVADSLNWEPCAAVPDERIEALRTAHDLGIETWVSFEPVLYPEQVYNLLNRITGFVSHVKVGTLNYHPHGKTIDWKAFGFMMYSKLQNAGVKYYFKKDLLKNMGVAEFKQNWECR